MAELLTNANALGQAFEENQKETQKLQLKQKDLEAQWLKEKSDFDELVLQGNGLVAQLLVLEEEKNRRQRNITSLQKEIQTTTQKHESIRRAVLDKRAEYEDVKRKMSEYAIKMKTHRECVAEAENGTPLLKQVAKIKQEIQALEIMCSDLKKTQLQILTNEEGAVMTEEQLQSELAELKQQITQRRYIYDDKKQQLKSSLAQRKSLEVTSLVLTKKNSALLIRMTKKIEDHKEKYSSLMTQRDYLLKMTDTTRGKLERFGDSP